MGLFEGAFVVLEIHSSTLYPLSSVFQSFIFKMFINIICLIPARLINIFLFIVCALFLFFLLVLPSLVLTEYFTFFYFVSSLSILAILSLNVCHRFHNRHLELI